MTVKASGTPISFLDIISEFGKGSISNNNNNISLGSYRIQQQLDTIATSGVGGTFYPIADGMPLPGQQIKMSDFYSKTKTIIIQYGSSYRSTVGRSLLSDFGNRNAAGIGFTVFLVSPDSNFNVPTENIGTSKVVVSIAGSLGSRTGARTNCALNIDSNFGNNLIIEIGPNATISGGGGQGGTGGTGSGVVGGAGGNGGSALGVSTTGITSIFNRGRIQLGMGGGGGGASGRRGSSGPGGGGGAGYPVGNGGLGGVTGTSVGRPGYPGTISIGGTGGTSLLSNTDTNRSGIGGTGGSTEPLTNALNGGSNPNGTVGGAAGLNGYRMVVASGIPTPVIVPITYALIPSKQIGIDSTSTNPTL